MCGGNAAGIVRCFSSKGTSPRVRGKHSCASHQPARHGYIPACAGETLTRTVPMETSTVHPRVCGGNRVNVHLSVAHSGTSPRVRGKPARTRRSNLSHRYIPACAGETIPNIAQVILTRVHPRVCGGNAPAMISFILATGTSPRVRGKPNSIKAHAKRQGYIPACAGETARLKFQPPVMWVHPRVCGGNSSAAADLGPIPGTSPRVRGKPPPPLTDPPLKRYIPACAGETQLPPPGTPGIPVHPRVCGGNPFLIPPFVWGIRYIPACAGETSPCGLRWWRRTVHPRVCGGNGWQSGCAFLRQGTSPRVRGKRVPFVSRVRETGVHPRVCGGNEDATTHDRAASGTSPRVRGKQSEGVEQRLPRAVHPRVCGGNVR